MDMFDLNRILFIQSKDPFFPTISMSSHLQLLQIDNFKELLRINDRWMYWKRIAFLRKFS